MRGCSAGGGAATAVSASTVEVDRDGFWLRRALCKVRHRSRSPRHVLSGSLLVCESGRRSANEVSRHEAMRSVAPIVSSSRCVGLRISDKENDRLSMTLVECRKQRQQGVETVGMLRATSRAAVRMNLKTSPRIHQPKSHRFVLTTTAQMLVKVLRGKWGFCGERRMMSHSDPNLACPDVRSDGTGSVLQPISPGPVKSAEDGGSKMMEEAQATSAPAPRRAHSASARTLQAYVDRRSRLVEQIRAQFPHFTEAEIEERMEQFGA